MIKKEQIVFGSLVLVLVFTMMSCLTMTTLADSPNAMETDLYVRYDMNEDYWAGNPNEVVDYNDNLHGTSFGAITVSTGKFDRCGYFNNESHVKLSDSLVTTSTFSLSCFISLSEDGTNSRPIYMQSNPDDVRASKFLLQVNENNSLELLLQGFNSEGKTMKTDKVLNATRWYHVVVIVDETHATFYLEKEQILRIPHEQNGRYNEYVTIRNIGGGDNTNFFGKIDAVRIYNASVSALDVSLLYTNSLLKISEEEGTPEPEPEPKSKPEPEPEPDLTVPEPQVTFNMFSVFGWMFDNFGFWGTLMIIASNILTLFVFKAYTYNKRPIIYVTKENGYKNVRLGRLVNCEKSEQTEMNLYWRYTVQKKTIGFLNYYSVHPFAVMRTFRWRVENYGILRLEFFPHYYVKNVHLPPALQFKSLVLKDGRANKYKYYVFRFFNLLFSQTIARAIHDTLEFEASGNVETVPILQLEYLQERKYLEYLTMFEKKEYFEIADSESWVKYPEIELISLFHEDQEYFTFNVREYFKELDEIQRAISEMTESAPDGDIYEMPKKEKKQYEVLWSRNSALMDEHGLNDVVLDKFTKVFKILEEKRKKQDELIEHEIMDENDKFFFYTLFQIYDLQKNPEYRNVMRLGDPIPRIRTITDLNEAIREALDFREVLSYLELKIQEERNARKGLEKKYQEERDRATKLHVEMEENVENEIKQIRTYYEKRTKPKIEFAREVMELSEETGLDIGATLKEKVLESLEKTHLSKIELNDIMVENKALKDFISTTLKKSEQIEFKFPDHKKKKIQTLDDLKKLKEETESGRT